MTNKPKSQVGGKRLLCGYPETQFLLGDVHRNTVADLADQGLLERVNIGRRTLFTFQSIVALVENRKQQRPQSKSQPANKDLKHEPSKRQLVGADIRT